MLLVLDVSNRETTVALFGGDPERAWRLASDPDRTSDDWGLSLGSLLDRFDVGPGSLTGAVVGSVVPAITARLIDACRGYFGISPLVVGPGVRTGIKILTESPREVGADRIANAVAALRRYGGPAIVVDLATATTLDVISADGGYRGSVITPGMELSIDALAAQTAQLREVDLSAPTHVVGTTTASAVQSGIVFGTAALVDGLVRRIRAEIGADARVIATGRHAELIRAQSEVIDVVDPGLTVDGLRLIWEFNRRERRSP